MEVSFRPLTINDYDVLSELLQQRPYVFNGYTDESFKKSIFELVGEWLTNPYYYLPSFFIDGVYYGSIVCKESNTAPSWAWCHWVTRPGWASKMYTPEGVAAWRRADQELFNEMEINRKLNRIFLSYRVFENESTHLKNAGMSDRMFAWMSRQGFRISKYRFIDDCFVEANEEAKYPYQRALLSDRTWPFKTVVRMGVLI